MKVAFAGLGSAFQRAHLPAARAQTDVEVIAIADTDDQRRQDGERCFPRAAAFDDAASMIAKADVDLVVIALDPAHHASLAAAALGRGNHVLCEKPAALDRAGLQRLAHACARRPDRGLIPVHQYRYSPAWRELRRWSWLASLLPSPTLLDVAIERSGDDPLAQSAWRADLSASGGILADHAVHFLALAETLGWQPRPLAVDRRHDASGRESASALLGTSSGSMRILASRSSSTRRTSIKLHASPLDVTWSNDAFVAQLGARIMRRCTVPSLASRDHVDRMYLPLYAELSHRLRDVSWRVARTTQALRITATLITLLDMHAAELDAPI